MSQSSYSESSGYEGQEDSDRIANRFVEREDRYAIDEIAERFQCMTLHKREATKRVRGDGISGEELSSEKYGLWRQDQKSRAARLEKQLKARWELEQLIEEQLSRYHAHYNQAMIPSRLKDVAQQLMPSWAPPQELAILSWLGDWRPSAILDLLRGMARFSCLSDSTTMEQLLSQLIHEVRIEEAIIDEEMAEIHATCILHLPFAPVNSSKTGGAALHRIQFQAEFRKIERVITKAQHLRYKALELVVKKVLNQTEAAEFLVAFAGIQDAIHQFAEQQRLRKGLVTVPFKASGQLRIKQQSLRTHSGNQTFTPHRVEILTKR